MSGQCQLSNLNVKSRSELDIASVDVKLVLLITYTQLLIYFSLCISSCMLVFLWTVTVHSILPIHFKYFPASSALILNKGCSHKYDPSCNPNTLRLPGINRPVLGNEREKFEIWHSILICNIQNLSMSSLEPVRWHGSWTPMWCWEHGSVSNRLTPVSSNTHRQAGAGAEHLSLCNSSY